MAAATATEQTPEQTAGKPRAGLRQVFQALTSVADTNTHDFGTAVVHAAIGDAAAPAYVSAISGSVVTIGVAAGTPDMTVIAWVQDYIS